MSEKTPITVAYGDGIGPEIMNATLDIIQAAGAQLELDVIEIGEKMYHKGETTGIDPRAWDSLRRTRVFLKAPITTPQGGGFKSLNVTTRKVLGLYANVRPCVAYAPFVETKHPGMDVVVVRENEEDLYAGIEYQQSPQVVAAIKIISRPGSEKIVRYAFEYARRNNRKKVTCFTKDNILKQTDGLFHKIYDEIGEQYPDIEKEHWIVDIGAAKLADTPEAFDVIVMPNLYGDILSDVAAQIAGSVGLAGSANIGDQAAMFEAIHGSAPRRAGQNLANPSGLLLGAVMMLVHISQTDVAERVHNAWLKTLEDGIHTYDIYDERVSKQKVGTREFAQAVVDRLGQRPEKLKAVSYRATDRSDVDVHVETSAAAAVTKTLVGVDVFVDYTAGTADELGAAMQRVGVDGLQLTMIANRGVKVFPEGAPETFCSDQWRCRFQGPEGTTKVAPAQIVSLLGRVADAGIDFIKTENHSDFDGVPAYSLGQGE